MHYKNHNALTNGRTIILLLFLFHIKLLIMFLVCRPLARSENKKWNKINYYKERTIDMNYWYEKYYNQMIFTEIIMLTLFGYLVVLVYGYLNWNLPLVTTQGEVLSTVIGQWTFIIALYALPFAAWWMLFQKTVLVNGFAFKKVWRGLHFNIKSKSKWTLVWWLVFMIRRILFASIAFNYIQLGP